MKMVRPDMIRLIHVIFLSLCLIFPENGLFAETLSNPPQQNPSFLIPEELGTLQESYSGAGPKTVIHIQDAHDSLEAQENIAKLIEFFTQTQGITTVFEEGYEGPVPTDEFYGVIPNSEVRERVAYYLMDQLRLGGAEYAHINRKQDFQLIGIDQINLHLENIRWYRENAELKEKTDQDLTVLQTEIEKLAHRYFEKELKEWLKLEKRFEEGKIDILSYLKRIGADHLLPREDEIKSINPRVFFSEIQTFEKQYAEKFLKNERDQKIFEYLQWIHLMRRLNHMEVTPEQYQKVKIETGLSKTKELAEFLARYSGQSIVLSKKWEENIQKAVAFYELVHQRDEVMEKTLQDFFQNSEEKAAILVFGGFHTPQIKDVLKRQGYSYQVIAPKISQVSSVHQKRYREMMTRNIASIQTPAMIAGLARIATDFEIAQVKGPLFKEVLLEYNADLGRAAEAVLNHPRSQHLSRELFNREFEIEMMNSSVQVSPESEERVAVPVRSEVRNEKSSEEEVKINRREFVKKSARFLGAAAAFLPKNSRGEDSSSAPALDPETLKFETELKKQLSSERWESIETMKHQLQELAKVHSFTSLKNRRGLSRFYSRIEKEEGALENFFIAFQLLEQETRHRIMVTLGENIPRSEQGTKLSLLSHFIEAFLTEVTIPERRPDLDQQKREDVSSKASIHPNFQLYSRNADWLEQKTEYMHWAQNMILQRLQSRKKLEWESILSLMTSIDLLHFVSTSSGFPEYFQHFQWREDGSLTLAFDKKALSRSLQLSDFPSYLLAFLFQSLNPDRPLPYQDENQLIDFAVQLLTEDKLAVSQGLGIPTADIEKSIGSILELYAGRLVHHPELLETQLSQLLAADLWLFEKYVAEVQKLPVSPETQKLEPLFSKLAALFMKEDLRAREIVQIILKQGASEKGNSALALAVLKAFQQRVKKEIEQGVERPVEQWKLGEMFSQAFSKKTPLKQTSDLDDGPFRIERGGEWLGGPRVSADRRSRRLERPELKNRIRVQREGIPPLDFEIAFVHILNLFREKGMETVQGLVLSEWGKLAQKNELSEKVEESFPELYQKLDVSDVSARQKSNILNVVTQIMRSSRELKKVFEQGLKAPFLSVVEKNFKNLLNQEWDMELQEIGMNYFLFYYELSWQELLQNQRTSRESFLNYLELIDLALLKDPDLEEAYLKGLVPMILFRNQGWLKREARERLEKITRQLSREQEEKLDAFLKKAEENKQGEQRSEVRETDIQGTLILHADELVTMRLEVREELFKAAYMNQKQVRVVIAGNRGQIPDEPVFSALLQLNNVYVSPLSEEEAYVQYGVPKSAGVVIAKNPSLPQKRELLAMRLTDRVGEIAFAVLYLRDGGFRLEAGQPGKFLNPSQDLLERIEQTYLAHLVVALAA